MAKNIIPINCTNCVFGGDCRNITAIDCTSMKFDATHNDKTFLRNAEVTPQRSKLVDGAIGINESVTGLYGLYYCKTTGGGVGFNLGDPKILKDCLITFVRTTTGANTVTFNAFGTELFEFAALPQTQLTTQGDALTITSNGTDWFITSRGASTAGGGSAAWGSITIGTGIVTQSDLMTLISLRL